MNNLRSGGLRNQLGAIITAVVGHDNLAFDVVIAQRPKRFFQANLKGICLIETRHDDGYLQSVLSFGRRYQTLDCSTWLVFHLVSKA
jgi:hypothetical protein